MTVADDLKDIFEKMPAAFVPEKAAGVKAIIELRLSGNDGGNWIFEIADGKISVVEGQADSPDLTVSMDAGDYVAMSLGETNPMALFMSGKIQVQGDVTLALKFQEMFDRDRV